MKITPVALRKESVDRNPASEWRLMACLVALRKESVDRNGAGSWRLAMNLVALRKESVDRNTNFSGGAGQLIKSLSARRAWIEIASCWRV